MVCQCGGTGKGIKSKVGGELEHSLQALFTYLCDLCAFECAISPLIFNIIEVVYQPRMENIIEHNIPPMMVINIEIQYADHVHVMQTNES
jgi:hypothetical protein